MIFEIKRAINQDEFYVVFQPILDLKKNRICGVEVLARWQHQQLGEVNPCRFINHIETGELGITFSCMIIRKACALLSTNKTLCGFLNGAYISFNLSVENLLSPDVLECIINCSNVLKKFKINLAIELTERQNAYGCIGLKSAFNTLKSKGIFMVMDDFGSGYTSKRLMSYLSFDIVKIDRSLTNYFNKNQDEMTEFLQDISRNFPVDIVFEGVETKQQLNSIHRAGAEYAQGYYISPPQKLGCFLNFLTDGF